jgi:hypothetical protein
MPAAADATRALGHELAARFRAGEASSRDVTLAHLDAAERQNHALNAWLLIDREHALLQADAADARLAAARAEGADAVAALHPLLGMPVALKDLVSVAGGQCTAGSRILEGYVAPYDAHITERLRDAGAVILGKTNMDEFAMGSSNEYSGFGPVSNPWDLDTVPGGSIRDRHGPRRVHPPAGGTDGDRRAQADVRAREPVRDRGLRLVARPDRAVRPRRPGRGGPAPRGRRPG